MNLVRGIFTDSDTHCKSKDVAPPPADMCSEFILESPVGLTGGVIESRNVLRPEFH